ncbi:glycosyltransferase family 39 protein [Novosphingopyxis sp.]|uniref:glycosyltransferase family 39 protein n=1 Tax=Novosphingopyxis sp. TaxID=2709690 RepID=UPI003B5CD8AA
MIEDSLRSPRALAAIWLCFLLPRLAVLLLHVAPASDAAWYYQRAASLAAGQGYLGDDGAPTAFWPPGWPMALSLVFRLFGPSFAAVGLFNLACAALTAWLLLDLARRLAGGETAARLALLLYAVYPNAIGYVPLALTEMFYTMLLLAGARLLIARPTAPVLAAAGIVFGFATLVKAQTLIVIPLVLGIALLRRPRWWRALPSALARGALVLAIAALAVLPWSLRNCDAIGACVPVSTNGGYTLLTGNNDSAAGDYTPGDPAVRRLEAAGLGEVGRDAEARRLGMAWIAEHPARFVRLIPLKLWRLWAPDGEAEWGYQAGYDGYGIHASVFRALRLLNQFYYAALLAGFALFAWIQLRRRRGAGERLIGWWLLPYAIAAYPSAIAMVFSGQSRFHFPVMPFVALSVGWLLAGYLARRRGPGYSPSAVAMASANRSG